MSGTIPGLPVGTAGTKFGAGVLGKTSHVALACVTAWGIVIYRLSNNLVLDAALIISALIVTCFAIWFVRSSQTFAENNPAQALLEGSSLVDLRRAEMQAKDGKLIDSKPVELRSIGSSLPDNADE